MRFKNNLKECAAFGGLADSDLDAIAGLGVLQEHEAGSALFREGDSADEFFIIQEGKVAVQMTIPADGAQSGKKTTVDIAQANEVLGWSAIIEPHVHTLSAICLRKTSVLAFNGARFRTLLQGNRNASYEIVKGLARVMALRLDDTRRLLVAERSWLS